MLDNKITSFDTRNFNERQEEILHLIAKGYGYSMISQIVPVTYSTVMRACRAIRNKTGLAKREDIMRYAQEHGYGESETQIC
jgi:DNA-binding NarL/FixJ family response regulator